MKIVGNKVVLKTIRKADLADLWQLVYSTENREWKKWDAPYYPLVYKTMDEFIKQFDLSLNKRLAIWVDGKLIGTVSYYWEHEASFWLEVGVCIYSPKYWRNGYGMESLSLWISHLFNTMPLVRVGLTTWSGNINMMKCAEKLGMKQEARLRRCRLWDDKYYDSIRYGVLREEWNL